MKVKPVESFGAKTTLKQAELILIPVPWEVTTSYGGGTSQGPDLIRKACFQLDFFNPELKCAYNHKIHFEKTDPLIQSLGKEARVWAKDIQKNWKEDTVLNKKQLALCEKVNQASESLQDWLYEKSSKLFQEDKIPALVGGDHSVSEGLVRLIGEKLKGEYSILHLDAHADLRESYQGFKYSHASVMHNILNLPFPPKKLIQVGIRDLCETEYKKISNSKTISCFFDVDLSFRLFSGEKWADLCQEIVKSLSSEVYVSLDVDALSWHYAPGTGTPVPGGLSFNQLLYLFSEIKRQKKRLIAFDVVETAGGEQPNSFSEWNGNVSARLIYYLAGLVLLTHNKIQS